MAASEFELKAAEAAKHKLRAVIKASGVKGITVGVGLGSDYKYRLEVHLVGEVPKNFELPIDVDGVPVNIVRMPLSKVTAGHPDAGASAVDKILDPFESVVRSFPRLAMSLSTLITEARDLTEKGKPGGAPDSKNPKRRALIKKLKKTPGVRDAEALASWIGRKIAGMRGGMKRAKRRKKSKKER